MNGIVKELGVIAAGIIGLAIIAVLVSNRAATSKVVDSVSGGFANAIKAATGPVSGGLGAF